MKRSTIAKFKRVTLQTAIIVLIVLPTASLVAFLTGTLQKADAAASDRLTDFNGDGYSDLAIGAQGEDIGLVESAGGVNAIYGSSAGLRATAAGDTTGRADQGWNQNTASVEETSEENDMFGWSLA